MPSKKREERTWVEIDLDAIANNYAVARSFLREQTRMIAVVKANAYGNGAPQVARLLEGEPGVYGFGVASFEEGMRLRRAEKAGAIRAVILTRAADRRAFGVARCFPVKLSVVRTRALFRFLSKRRALPALERFPTGFSPKAFVAAALSRNNLKNYMFSGIVLISVAFLTPLKIYYLVFGSLSLAMALLTLTPLAEGKDDGDGALKRLLPAPEEYVRETEQNTAHGDDANGNDNIFDDKTCGNNCVVRNNSGEENGSDGNSHGNDNGGDGDNSRDDKDGGNDTPGGKDTTDGSGR